MHISIVVADTQNAHKRLRNKNIGVDAHARGGAEWLIDGEMCAGRGGGCGCKGERAHWGPRWDGEIARTRY